MNVPLESLKEIESGGSLPSRGLLNKMASKYKWRVEVLLMPDVIPLKPIPRDYRQKTHRRFDPSLLSLIYDIQGLTEEILELIEGGLLDFPTFKLAQIGLDTEIDGFTNNLRKQIGLTHDKQLQFKDYRDFFQFLRYKIESFGVLVFLEKMDTSLCRGFAVLESGRIAAIAVNDREDSYAPKIFTLIHELAHVMLRKPGISDQNDVLKVERYCNRFAATFLMPKDLIKASIGMRGPYSNKTIYEMAKYLTVSQSSLVVRLEDLGYVEKGFYESWLEQIKGTRFTDNRITKTRLRKGMIPPHTKSVKHIGALASKAVLESTYSRRISDRQAFEILNLGSKHFDKALNQSINQIKKAEA